jgi:hypothetical protein
MEQDRRERILQIQRREHFLGKPEAAALPPFKPGSVSGLKARGALDKRQASTANRLLVMLRREPTEPYHMAKAAIGRSAAEVIEAIIVLGEPISRYAVRVGIPHAHAAGRLKAGLDSLADHFAAPAENASRRATG